MSFTGVLKLLFFFFFFFLLSRHRGEGKPPEVGLEREETSIFPDFHLHLSETVVDGSCYLQI